MSRKNLIVGQSGGPTAVINSSLYGVVSEGMRHPEAIEHVYGMINGIEGFLNGTVLDFAEALPGEKLDGLKVTPGAYLGSCRYKLPESLEDPVYPMEIPIWSSVMCSGFQTPYKTACAVSLKSRNNLVTL